MEILLKHKEFIFATATDLINPKRGNDKVNEILREYNKIDPSVEVLSECATCEHIYTTSFKIILAYCESKNWFETIVKTKK